MGSKSFRKQDRIAKLYKKYQKITDNFSNISEELLVRHPQLLHIIRLACGMSQREFSGVLGIDRSALVHSELGISKTMKLSNAKRICSKLQDLTKNAAFSEKNILENYRKFLQRATCGQPAEILRKLGRKALRHKTPTIQETGTAKLLDSLGISYEKEGVLTLDNMDFVFEFLVPNSTSPKVVIECKSMETTNKHSLKIIGYRIAYEIGYKSHLIHKNFPKAKIIAIIRHNQEKFPQRALKILQNETDSLLVNSDKHEISSTLKRYVEHPAKT